MIGRGRCFASSRSSHILTARLRFSEARDRSCCSNFGATGVDDTVTSDMISIVAARPAAMCVVDLTSFYRTLGPNSSNHA
jgi:hypothetical protein